jgi:hypothetical protein
MKRGRIVNEEVVEGVDEDESAHGARGTSSSTLSSSSSAADAVTLSVLAQMPALIGALRSKLRFLPPTPEDHILDSPELHFS